jgi:restriction endonuclease S subunit
MRVTVWEVVQFTPRIEERVADATVSLYKSEEDRTDQINRVNQATTDTTGEVFFDYLPDEIYYLAIDHSSLGYEEDVVSTPAGTTSLVNILYY